MSKNLSDLNNYDFDLPRDLIAHEACRPRENSRLMVIDRKSQSWTHHHVRDLPDIVTSRDLMVVNNSKVIPARMLGHRIGGGRGAVECFLIKKLDDQQWECLMKATARIGFGFEFEIKNNDSVLNGKVAERIEKTVPPTYRVAFSDNPLKFGKLPFPPYIERSERKTKADDEFEYQTVYASSEGSVAAPTAGLHFSEALLRTLSANGVEKVEVTLHVGLGTFQPIKSQKIDEHEMHLETCEIPNHVCEKINAARKERKNILAVGTTSFRTLQSAYDLSKDQVLPGQRDTDLFIYPKEGNRHRFVVDKLLTNFHLPKSSLILLVSAFANRELILEAYKAAILDRYRFFSLGDAMLIV